MVLPGYFLQDWACSPTSSPDSAFRCLSYAETSQIMALRSTCYQVGSTHTLFVVPDLWLALACQQDSSAGAGYWDGV